MNDTDRNAFFLEEIRKRLSEKRFIHSVNVAEKAEYLAKKYGADEKKAYTAGLLHDIMKDTPKEVQLDMLENKYGQNLSGVEKANHKLYHAMSGALFIERELNVTDREIIDAVRYHTTARKNMSILEKVLYIADYISDDRDYNGVERMREKAEISLECAMREGLQFSIIELAEKEKAIHPDSLDAYNEIIIGGK